MSTTTQDIAVRPAGSVGTVRQEFGTTELQASHETASAAVAAREAAAVQARYIVAMQRPRNTEQFRKRLMDMCLKPGFAAKAEYAKPLGKKWNPQKGKEEDQFAYGPSIRFIEAALQAFGNVYPEIATVFDNPQARICRVTVTDLESNLSYTAEVMITKVVERKAKAKWKNGKKTDEMGPPAGRVVLSERLNSEGEVTYLVLATDDEVLTKQNALLSKSLRTLAQRLLPFDIVEEAIALAKSTVADKDAKDPDAAKREIIDYFASQGIEPIDLEAYLGKSLAKPLVAAEMQLLRAAYKAVVSGESTWEELLSARSPEGSQDAQDAVKAARLAEAEAHRNAGSQTTTADDSKQEPFDQQRSDPPPQQQNEQPPKSTTARAPLQFGNKPGGSK